MRVLHICNDFSGSKSHMELYEALDKCSIEQTVFTYFRDPGKVDVNRFKSERVRFHYSVSLKWWHRLFYHFKIRDVFRALVSSVDLKEIDLVHATTLFSDGALAHRIYRAYGIPYICAVRSTDVYAFLKYAPHTWGTGKRVARDASRLVFITENIKARFEHYYSVRKWARVNPEKTLVQPNGVDAFWIQNQFKVLHRVDNSLLFVGELKRRKHASLLCRAVLDLVPRVPGISLTLVGGLGQEGKKILKFAKKSPEIIRYLGVIEDKNRLLELYRSHSFLALPSERETFGLVYVEALTQSLPIIYSENDGVDGLLPDGVGERIRPGSKRSIEEGILRLLSHYPEVPVSTLVDFERFDWTRIAGQYLRIYEEIASVACR